MTLELYTSPTPNGWKVSIMIEELREAGVSLPDLTVHTVDIFHGEHLREGYEQINPNRKIPALVHEGHALMESCAILQYLGERFPSPLLPLGDEKWEVLPWVYWQAANVGPASCTRR
ncbi:MAG: glutathione S-transferase N-terminal domain-containing protein, partial [Myxococcota bacterium]